MILPLPRPQYVAIPEGFITAIAWRAYSAGETKNSVGKKVALRFKGTPATTKTLDVRITEPKGENSPLLEKLFNQLE